MMFVDGEYLTIQGQKLAQDKGFSFEKGAYWIPEVFLWMPDFNPLNGFRVDDENVSLWLQVQGVRCSYYTSAVGADDELQKWRHTIREARFRPVLLKKIKATSQSKGVDISLATDMLTHAFLDNYEAAILVSGDADFIPVVEQVQRQGKIVYLIHLGMEYGTSNDLCLAVDLDGNIQNLVHEKWVAKPQAAPVKV